MISGCSSVGYGPMLNHFCAYMCVYISIPLGYQTKGTQCRNFNLNMISEPIQSYPTKLSHMATHCSIQTHYLPVLVCKPVECSVFSLTVFTVAQLSMIMSATSQVVHNVMLIMLPVHYLNHWEIVNIDVGFFAMLWNCNI